jgi:hypothetical protein
MARTKRSSDGKTNKLLSCWVSEIELKMIQKAIPANNSMSEFLRNIILREVKRMLIEKQYNISLNQRIELKDLANLDNQGGV